MKRIFFLLVTLWAVGAVEAKPKSLKIIAETPHSAFDTNKAHYRCEGNDVIILPNENERQCRFTIEHKFDFTGYKSISFTLENLEAKPVRITLSITNTREYFPLSRRALPQCVGDLYYLAPHEKREVVLNFPEPLKYPDVAAAFKLMRYTPYSRAFGFASYDGDLSDVSIISFHCSRVAMKTTKLVEGWRVGDLTVHPGRRVKNPKVTDMPYKEFFPFIDCYGQYKHDEWLGKVHSDADLKRAREVEEADLAKHTGPTDRNRYGGWASGPRHEATGRFYFKKVDGKWWFIDPEGCLWWSHGVVRVTTSSAVTPLDGRRDYFESLPQQGSDFAPFYYTHDALLKPYYTARGIKETYDFSSANCYRKYGENYKDVYAELAHRRLRSWGLNTIANSSDKDICLLSKTPYIERLEVLAREIKGSGGSWWRFMDPWDPSFKESIIRQLKEREKELKDPYLLKLMAKWK